MDEQVRKALAKDRVIDITTIGRSSCEPRRIEMWFHNLDGDIYITGTPGKRDWYANMVANPPFTFHVKVSATADLPATARPITDDTERRAVLSRILTNLDRTGELETWMTESPLVAVPLTN